MVKMQIETALEAIDAAIERFHKTDSIDSPKLSILEQEKSKLSDLGAWLTANQDPLPITPVREQELYEPSTALQHFWIGFFYEKTHVPFNMVSGYSIPHLDLPLFKKAIQTMAGRHEILRTVPYFCESSQTVKQRILPEVDADSLVRLSDISTNNDKQQIIEQYLDVARRHVFEFQEGPPYCFTIFKYDPEKYFVLFNISHAIFDGVSQKVFENEFKSIYNAYCRNDEPRLKKPGIQYKDFCEWEKRFRTGTAVEAYKKYWFSQNGSKFPLQNLSTFTSGTVLNDHSYRQCLSERIKPYLRTPDDRTISAFYGVVAKAERTPAHTYRCAIDEATLVKINSFCRSKKIMFYTLFIAVLNATVYKRCAIDDIIIGANVALRDRTELQGMIGFLLNIVLIRTRIKGSDTFSQLLTDTIVNTSLAFFFKYFTLSRMLDELDIPYNAINTLFLNIVPVSSGRLTDFSQGHYNDNTLSHFDIDLHVKRYINGVEITCNYDYTIYNVGDIGSLLDEFMVLLKQYIEMPESLIGEV